MPWNYDDEEINGILDSNLKDSPPNPPAVNTAASLRSMLKSFWSAVRGQVSNAVAYVDEDFADQVSDMLGTVETRVAAAEAKADSVFTMFELAKFQGKWNPVTGLPALPAVPAANGHWWEVSASGNSSITGSSEPFTQGDRLIASDTAYFRIPQGLIPADKSVGPEKLVSWLRFELAPAHSKYAYTLRDEDFKMALGILKDGGIEGKFLLTAAHIVANMISTAAIQNGAVTIDKLGTDVTDRMGAPFNNDRSRFVEFVQDLANRVALAYTKDGSVYIQKLELEPGGIKESYLKPETIAKLPTPAFKRLNDPNLNDVEYISDDLWRSAEIDISTRTAINGNCFANFPHKKTPYLKGVNTSGFTLQFIQSNNITIRGRRYRGLWNPNTPGVVAGTVYKGFYGNAASDSYPGISGGTIGDYYLIDGRVLNASSVWIAGSKTRNGLTFKHGDLVVINASGPVIQSGPGDGYFDFDDFFEVEADGVFNGVSYKAGEFIYFLTNQAMGGPKYPRLMQSKPGEFFFMGTFDPATFNPASPKNGSLWVASAAGTWAAQGFTVAIGDHVGYSNGAYFMLEGKMKTIANGKAYHFPCTDAREISVRRADFGAAIGISAQGQSGAVSQRVIDDIEWLSDSMASVGGTATKLAALSGRSVTLHTYGGGTSEEEVRMLRYLIRTGDTVKGRTLLCTHGQNTGNSVSEIKKVAHEVYHIAGANQRRVIFFTVLGARTHAFSGGRIVVANHEDAWGTDGTNGTNYIALTEQFYKSAYPLQYVNVREVFLAAAVGRTTKDFTFEGMTEAQVATTYHIPPKSFFNEHAGKPDKSLYTFAGYHSAAGLPTGGAELTVMIRTANGTVGQEIYNIPGTGWVEFADDMVHLSDLGAQTLANFTNNLLISKNL